jgi:hypothetical protein
MEIILRLFSLALYLAVGSWLAFRWVLSTTERDSRLKKTLGVISFVVACWVGAYIWGNIQTRISILFFNPENHPHDVGLTGEAMHDGVGLNILVLFFGWVFAPICFALAGQFPMKREERVEAQDHSSPPSSNSSKS